MKTSLGAILGVFLTALATAFAGWSAYEAQRSRTDEHHDTIRALKLANRSYVFADNPKIVADTPILDPKKLPAGAAPLANALEGQLSAHHSVIVYGTSPAFQVRVTAACLLGNIGTLINKEGGITEADIKTQPLSLPSTMVPDHPIGLMESCQNPSRGTIGAVVYGAIHFTDTFGESHYSHFCYENIALIIQALGNPDPKKWKAEAIDAGNHLRRCDAFNDSDMPDEK